MTKKRPKNKQELPSKSGVGKKIVYRDKVVFEFKSGEIKYKNGEGRLKIDTKGYFSFLIKTEKGWQPVKGELLKIKLVKEKKPVGYGKKSV